MRTQFGRIRRRRAIAGFTLIEVIVVLLIIAVLVAIAAPSWNALLNRQRVGIIRDQAAQVIRQTQAEARRRNLAWVLVFDTSTDPPRFASQLQPLGEDERTAPLLTDTSGITNWETLGKGEVKENQVEVATAPPGALNQIVFDANGAVDQVSAAQSRAIGTRPYIFAVNVRHRGGGDNANRCVIVDTLLGATRTAEGGDCPPSG